MSVIRFIVGSLIIFFLLITGVSFLFPSHIRVSRAVDISAPLTRIHSALADPSTWSHWMPGAEHSLLIKKQDVVQGIRLANGQSLWVKSVTNNRVEVMGNPSSSVEMIAGWNILGRESDSHYTVQWYMDFSFDWYPWEKFASLLLETRYGNFMERGLQQLKVQCEQP